MRTRANTVCIRLTPVGVGRISMDIYNGEIEMGMRHGKRMLRSGVDALENAADQMRHSAGHMTDRAMHGARRAGNEVSSFAQQRPVETALFSAAAVCLIAGLTVWCTRPER